MATVRVWDSGNPSQNKSKRMVKLIDDYQEKLLEGLRDREFDGIFPAYLKPTELWQNYAMVPRTTFMFTS